MNLTLFKTALIIVLAFCFNAVKAQPYSITSNSYSDTCNGNVVFTFGNQPVSGLTVTTYFGDGTSATSSTASGGGAVMHKYNLPGTYTIKHVLFHNGTPQDTAINSLSLTLCTHAAIRVYLDANANCTFDASEYYYHHTPFSVEIDSAGVKIDTVKFHSGTYVNLIQGKTYTFKILNIPSGTALTCPSNGTLTVTLPISFNATNVDFGLQCNTNQFDLKVNAVHGIYRPVNYSYLYTSVTNTTCFPQNGTLTVTFDNKFNFHSATPTPANVSGNVVTWNLNNLSIVNSVLTAIKLVSNGSVVFGDTICATAVITPTTNDILPANNTKTGCRPVQASYDPNEKEVLPQGMITPGTNLEYTIHFENLGSDTAFNIHVLDTLSNHLDVNSFQMISSSHRAFPSVLKGPNNSKILKFDFPDIMLPDSNNKEANKGFVKFSMNAKTMLLPGTQIKNRAGIYFDINPVVMTNEVTNWLPVSVEEVVNSKNFSIYPNPTTGGLTIKTDAKLYQVARLVNNLGQVVAELQIDNDITTIELQSLPAGVYFMHLSGTAGTAVEKVQKQ